MKIIYTFSNGLTAERGSAEATEYFNDGYVVRQREIEIESLGWKVGDRVELFEPWDVFPLKVMPIGTRGTISEITSDDIWIKLDKHDPDFDEWDNCLQVSVGFDVLPPPIRKAT